MKKSVKKVENEEVKEGLLASMGESKHEFVDHSKQIVMSVRKSSKRVTPRDLASMTTPGGTMKTPTNAMR
jgi:hypothetical protein